MVRNAPDWKTTHALMVRYDSKRGRQRLAQSIGIAKRERSALAGRSPRSKQPPMRLRLFRADPHCFWCGKRVVLEPDPPTRSDLATLDHLYSRHHPKRLQHHREQKRALHVLACRVCNQERATAEQQGQQFVPKLSDKLSFARLADATLAQPANDVARPNTISTTSKPVERHPASVLSLKDEYATEVLKYKRRRVCTVKEAVEFAKENPA
jgi:hypothetical protein